MKSNQSGRSMMEMLGVLAIVGILTTTGISLYAKALHRRKIGNTIDQFVELSTNIRNAYMHRRNYSGLSLKKNILEKGGKTADTRRLVPDNMWSSDGKDVKNFMGGQINFEGDETKKIFYVDFRGLDKEGCTKVASSDWGKGTWVCVGGSGSPTPYKIGESLPGNCAEIQLSVGKANTNCSCTSNSCWVSWTVK